MSDTPMVRNKAQMYRLLAGGAFGNTIPQYFSISEWRASGDHERYEYWGVRSLIPGGPCRMFCRAGEVEDAARSLGCPFNISMMVDAIAGVCLWGEVFDTPTGLSLYGIEYPPAGGSWRKLMPSQGVQYGGIQARQILARHLNPSSLADLWATIEQYPGHVVEFSALDRCIGSVSGRNAVIWEVRAY